MEKYKYNCGSSSWMDRKMSKYVWDKLTEMLPLTCAPNLITFISFTTISSSFLLMLMYDTSLSKPIPNLVFLFAAISILIFQTADALDGK